MAAIAIKRVESSAGEALGAGCSVLFGLPFFLAGLGVMLYGLSLFYTYQQAGHWTQVNGEVIDCQLVRHRGSKGGTTYSIKGSYTYEYEGKSYTGTRFFLETGASSGHEFWSGRFEILEDHRKNRIPLPVLVNPENPRESLVYRQVSTIMFILPLFGGVFCLVGGGIICGGIYGAFAGRKKDDLRRKNPGRPWHAEGLWVNFATQHGSISGLLMAWVVSLGITAFISIFLIVISGDPSAPFFAKAIIYVFALIAALMLGGTMYKTLQYVKYGRSTLLISQIPFVPGEELAAMLLVRQQLVTDEGVKVTLKCEKKTTTGSGKHRHTHTDVLFTDTKMVRGDLARPGENRSALPIKFQLPPGLPSRDVEANPSFHWTLEVVAETPGIDFSAEFELPVYNVKDPSLIEKLVSE